MDNIVDNHKPLDAAAVSLMMMVSLICALQQIALKATADHAAPVLQVDLRSGIAALCVWLLIRFRGERVQMLGPVAFAGSAAGLLFAAEFLLLSESRRHTSASHVVVFLYTAPIFAALGLHRMRATERLAPVQWFGFVVCMLGIGIASLGGEAEGGLQGMIWATSKRS